MGNQITNKKFKPIPSYIFYFFMSTENVIGAVKESIKII